MEERGGKVTLETRRCGSNVITNEETTTDKTTGSVSAESSEVDDGAMKPWERGGDKRRRTEKMMRHSRNLEQETLGTLT